jgi:hypothetical protein
MPEATETSFAIVERDRPERASESIQRCQSMSVISSAMRAELLFEAVLPGPEHSLDRRVRVGLAAAAPAADVPALDAVEPLLAHRLERRPELRQLR